MTDTIPQSRTETAMIDVKSLATMLTCSTRHVYRLADAGRLPRPLKLGSLVRWRADEIRRWIDDGCPSLKGGR